MKNSILALIVLFITTTITFATGDKKNINNSSKHLIFGKVVDKTNGEEISGAEIKLGDKIIYTDLDGNFSAYIQTNNNEDITVSSISYNKTTLKLNSVSYETLFIQLSSK